MMSGAPASTADFIPPDGVVDNGLGSSMLSSMSTHIRSLEHQFRRMRMPQVQQMRRSSQDRERTASESRADGSSDFLPAACQMPNGNAAAAGAPRCPTMVSPFTTTTSGSSSSSTTPSMVVPPQLPPSTAPPSAFANRPGLSLAPLALPTPGHLAVNGHAPDGTPTQPGCSTSPLPRRNKPTLIFNGGGRDSSVGAPITPRRRLPAADEWSTAQSPMHDRVSDAGETQRIFEEIMAQDGILKFEVNGHKMKLKVSAERDLECLDSLGHGTCGHVWRMRHRQTGKIMAVKKMNRTGNREDFKRALMDMKVVLQSHDCPFIVQCYGCFINEAEVWICMQLMSTCLDKLSKRLQHGAIPEAILGTMTVSILKALNYLKVERHIIHRDVKPSNILLDANGTVKLCDFGISGQLVDSIAQTRNAGCTAYMAPERIDVDCKTYDTRADVWSLGITLVELALGRFPYDTSGAGSHFGMATKILHDPPPLLSKDDGFSEPFCNFIKKCLQKKVENRPKYDQLLKDPFITHYERDPADVGAWFRKVNGAG